LLYIIVALKSEAQAFVDKYKLQKLKIKKFTLYYGKDIVLIISGIGVSFAREATQTLINNFDIIEDEDIYLNIGICAANKQYSLGQCLEIGSLTYHDITYTFKDALNLLCLDHASSDIKHNIVDMESYGFYDAIIHSPAIKNFHIIKIVSDHFEPYKITKDKSKNLIFNQIDVINKIIFQKEAL